MEPGLGKTATTLCAVDFPALVVCPSAATRVWQDEVLQWVSHITPVIPRNRKEAFDVMARAFAGEHSNYCIIVTYDFFTKAPRYFAFKTFIFDEAHYLKSPTAARTQRYMQVVKAFKGKARNILVTGTPMPNRPIELYSLLVGAGATKEEIGTYHAFGLKFSGGYWNTYFNCWRYDKATNLPLLRQLLRKYMYIKFKEDVMSELPPITWQVVRLQRSGAVAKISDFEKSAIRRVKDGEEAPDTEAMNRGEIAQFMKEQGVLKAAVAVKMVKEFLEETNKKLIVFAWHKDVVDMIVSKVPAVRYTGVTARSQRIAAVDAFQNDPSVRVFVGNIQAAGVAITLTAASDVLFVESTWVPADLRQAADRAHRIGQHNPVTARILTFENSFDEVMLQVILRKMAEIGKTLNTLDGPDVSLFDVIKE
jgi:SWI/SNF-related matrix-associated actin-dependent regulator 1 of chromatin subfamily A